MKRVFLTVTNQISGHGSFSRQQRMAEALVKNGHTVIWLCPPGYKAHGINVVYMPLSNLPNLAFVGLYIKIILSFIKNYNLFKTVDSVFTVREYDALCMIFMPFFNKIPKVFFSRGDTISIYTINKPDNITISEKIKTNTVLFIYPFIQKIVLRLSKTVVVQASFLLRLLHDRYRDLSFNGIVLRNDCKEIDKYSCPSLNHNPVEVINLAFISPLFWECKGMGVIVDTISELESRNVDYKFHIIGDGPHKKKMKDLLCKLDIGKKVVWHGWVSDFSEVICLIDLVIVPSLYDSNPNLILEMISLNKPVIASNIDAHQEMLQYNELLFENMNIIDLCNKIELFYLSQKNREVIYKLLLNRKTELTFDWDNEIVNIMESSMKSMGDI